MNAKEVAEHYGAKVFETRAAAEAAGFVVTDTMSARNNWNKASLAQAIIHKLLPRRTGGDAAELGLVLENYSVSGCYKKDGSN